MGCLIADTCVLLSSSGCCSAAPAADVFVYPGSGATCDTQDLKLAQEKAQQAQEKAEEKAAAAAAAAAAAGGANGTGPAAAGPGGQQVKQEEDAVGDAATSHMVRDAAVGWELCT